MKEEIFTDSSKTTVRVVRTSPNDFGFSITQSGVFTDAQCIILTEANALKLMKFLRKYTEE